MDVVDEYLPRVVDGDTSYGEIPCSTDSSKWDPIHQALEGSRHGIHVQSGAGTLFTIAWVLGIGLGLLWVFRNGRTMFAQWRENRLRRANRRRHGIPDDDDRPFNIAYAAAAQARREHERTQTERVKLSAPQRELRRRATPGRPNGFQLPLIQRNAMSVRPLSDDGYPPTPNLVTYYASRTTNDPNPAATNTQPQNTAMSGVVPEMQRQVDSNRSRRKSRIIEKDLVDGDVFTSQSEPSRRGSMQIEKRGSKRHANPDGEEGWEMSQDKRARKGSSKFSPRTSDVEDISMEEVVSGVEPRGTKRDRHERESGSEIGPEQTDESPDERPTRRRRANGKVKGERSLRGYKRDRSFEPSSDSEKEQTDGRRKRGRKQEEEKEAEETEEVPKTIVNATASESDELSEFSKDAACGGRRIGQVWEMNGQAFKVGLDGRRLRHALIKQNRTKFAMPQDSAHADAKAKMEVIVEKWLNDEEYKAAKDNFDLAWQESPVSTPSAESKATEEFAPSGGRKRLLWDGPPQSPTKIRASIGVSTVSNPFDLAPSNASRRASAAHSMVNVHVESPKSRQPNVFSTWEKQDLEAVSLRKMRARLEKEKKEKENEVVTKSVDVQPAVTTAATSTPLASTTNLSSSTPPFATSTTTKAPFFPLSTQPKPSTPSSHTPITTSTAPKNNIIPSTTPSTILPSGQNGTTSAPSNHPADTASTPKPSLPFSFPSSSPAGKPLTTSNPPAAPNANPFALPSKMMSSSMAPAAPLTASQGIFSFNTAPPASQTTTEQSKHQATFPGFPPMPKATATATGASFTFNANQPKDQGSAMPNPTPFSYGKPGTITTGTSTPTLGSSIAKPPETASSITAISSQTAPSTTPATGPTSGGFSFNVKPAGGSTKSGDIQLSETSSTPSGSSLLARLGPSATSSPSVAAQKGFGGGTTTGSTDANKPLGFKFTLTPPERQSFPDQKKTGISIQGAASAFGQGTSQVGSVASMEPTKSAFAGPTIAFGSPDVSRPTFGSTDASKSVFQGGRADTSKGFALGSDHSKPVFGLPTSSASTTSAPGAGTPDTLKSTFGGTTSTKSIFGQSVPGSTAKPFFGGAPSEPTKTAFGQPTSLMTDASKQAGNVTSPFGRNPGSAFNSNPTTAFGSSAPPALGPGKPIFGFGLSADKGTTAPASSTTFNFGTNATPNTTTQTAMPSGKPVPVFGQKSAFGQSIGGFSGFAQKTNANANPTMAVANTGAFGQGSGPPSSSNPFSFSAVGKQEEKK